LGLQYGYRQLECSKQYGRSVISRGEILADDICHLKLMAVAPVAVAGVSRYWRQWQIAIDTNNE
jgi:hypothetical protein